MITKNKLHELIINADEKLVDINNIIFNKKFYSRVNGIDQSAVIDYSKDIINIPFILINQNNYIINGVHCYHALLKANQEQAKIKKIELPNEDVKVAGYLLDIDTGVRHPEKDKREICIDYWNADPSINKILINELKVSKSMFYEWTKDIRKEKQKQINRSKAIALLDPYKTLKDVANDFGTNERTIKRFKSDLRDIFPEIGKMSLDDEKGDYLETLKEQDLDFLEDYLYFKPFLFNIWNLKSKDGSNEQFGHFPKVFMDNLLYYHTEPFDLIYDPFTGGGTTIDSCKFMFRKCICSDLNPDKSREEIVKHDIQDGLPNELSYIRPNLVFLDPPYWLQSKNKYSTYKNDLANMNLEDFYSTIEDFLKKITAKKPNRIAIVIQPTQFLNENHKFEDHIFKFDKMLDRYKYDIEMRYILPYSTQQYNAQQVDIMKEEKKCLTLHRDLVVWKIKSKEKIKRND